jgi:hypothetical protein
MANSSHHRQQGFHEPNLELLRHTGWSVMAMCGDYCVAFRDTEEAVLAWRNGTWQQIGSRTSHSRDLQ